MRLLFCAQIYANMLIFACLRSSAILESDVLTVEEAVLRFSGQQSDKES
jgi:hypothetical protein